MAVRIVNVIKGDKCYRYIKERVLTIGLIISTLFLFYFSPNDLITSQNRGDL